ncbi:hypothetical protein VNO80_08264 [Phaseolus coccineus]|uniref:Uncharacterized protein n=1 Tax=Phaseolus coccineus TaxID=3886 RepID=A0AAN9RKM1_PHACN
MHESPLTRINGKERQEVQRNTFVLHQDQKTEGLEMESGTLVQHINPLMIKAKKLRRKRLRSTRSRSSSMRREELKVGCGVAQNPKQAFTIS